MEISINTIITIISGLVGVVFGVLWGHHREIAGRVTYKDCRDNRDKCPCVSEMKEIKKKIGMLLVLLALVIFLPGCTAVNSVTSATKDKSVAAGSDTWGGGGEVSAASIESLVPTMNFWFGRRRVWYASVKDKDTGEAAAKIVTASHSALSVSAGTDGVSIANSNTPATGETQKD